MKKIFLAVAIVLILILVAIYLFRFCEPRIKEPSEDEVLSAFVQANIKFSCEIKNNPQLKQDQSAAEKKVNEAYAEFGFPVDDDEKMFEILNKYESDQDIIRQIQEGVEEC